ncbi:WXG100 family type VII secretion target [Gordonia desulfuricans]|uniref:ESAT-6-like protein n=1 Tax=Gordonia desulfuricans TaxID=89051 RepID=A0A7K3LUL5_9ACTN|nr:MULTISPECIES: WXG100 family type VII secretion target [Gordonia]EMP11467.1 secretion protein [Gordonia sp. NB41Y]NDK91277.1 WXG100 family type VII secretion target [Gordonia desulfuricans]WLP89774.1 WXG100 family type VII secretion target [Gordonia sp. NB41Y]
MSGRIQYDFAALGDLQGGLNNQFQRLEDLAAQLKRQVAALDGNWRSPAAKSAYEQAQQHWDQVFAQSREQLVGLGRGVGNARNVMHETDSMIARRFSGA